MEGNPYNGQQKESVTLASKTTRILVSSLASLLLFAGSAQAGSAAGGSQASWTYTVQPQDTLWKIGQKYGIPLRAMIGANPQLSNPDIVWAGLKIQVPIKPSTYASGQFPLKKGTYQPFENTYGEQRVWTPDGYTTRSHEGVDIFAKKGTPVYAAMGGTVINYGWNQYGGWRLTVKVDDSTAFYYAHLSGYAAGIGMGSTIRKGQLIGYVGDTGYGPVGTSGNFLPHLHFGIYKTNVSPWKTVDPYVHLRWWALQQ
ncbi:LysM peptidoglycan-binding domain-containing protein [Paenibacillus thermoaerophilus]|nr:LysM peptidoglycan-binding domain-containing protein [Paenibacillus thermoaerophilus]